MENCLECCFGSVPETHQLSTFQKQLSGPHFRWIYPNLSLTFFFFFFSSGFCCPHQETHGATVLQGPQFWCWKDSCHKNEWTCSPTQGLMRIADSSPYETYFCIWTAVDVVHWLPNIQFFTLFSIFTNCSLRCCCSGDFWAALLRREMQV